ncbi:HTH-type transcriptional regulator LrpC [Thermoflexales bacterium]|nr:HTH-type transcriptional regulator LrpC [Thermoflexales bacterium]
MTFKLERVLDATGRKLLRALQENARLSYSELGRQVGLSAPAAAERVRRLEEAELIIGYHAEVDPAAMGYGVLAFIRLTTSTDKYPRVLELAQRLSEIRECHHVTGGEAFIMKVLATSIPHLESIIAQLSIFGATSTSIVLSSPVRKYSLEAADS